MNKIEPVGYYVDGEYFRPTGGLARSVEWYRAQGRTMDPLYALPADEMIEALEIIREQASDTHQKHSADILRALLTDIAARANAILQKIEK